MILIVVGILFFVLALILLIVRRLEWTTVLISIFMGITALGFITMGYYGEQNQQYGTMTANQSGQNIGKNNDSNLNDNNGLDNNTSGNNTSRQSRNVSRSQGQTSRSRQSSSSNSRQSSNSNSGQSKSSQKDKYLAELDDLTIKTDSMYKNSGETMREMKATASNVYKLWDDELNEIYGVLKQELSSSEMDNLRQKQREWIKYRDSEGEAAASQYAGGTMAPLEQTMTEADLTKDRCYELVNLYMK